MVTLGVPLAALANGDIDTVYVSTRMNTVISMPSKVLIVDPGNQDYAINYLEDLVIIKSKSTGARPTSLLVKSVTEVNIWIVAYRDVPPKLLVKFNPGSPSDSFKGGVTNNGVRDEVISTQLGEEVRPRNLDGVRPNVAVRNVVIPPEVNRKVKNIMGFPREYNDIGQRLSGIYFMLSGIYLDADYIYFKFIIINNSQVAYELDLVSFEHQYAQKFGKKQQAVQGNVYVSEYFDTVNVVLPGREERAVYLLPIYAFNEKDNIRVKMTEKVGERLIDFDIPGKVIINGERL